MKNPMISIIVPVYNTYEYLQKCIDSIRNQSYGNIEILLVNDGSTDDSLEICMMNKKLDERISVFDIVNSGVSAARNVALSAAKGDYILFVDSDDWIEIDACRLLADQIEISGGIDTICFGSWISVDDDVRKDSKKNMNNNENTNLKTLLEAAFSGGDTGVVVLWNKIFNRNTIEENQLRFRELTRGEDILFVAEYLMCLDSGIRIIDERLYNYRKNPESITRRRVDERTRVEQMQAFRQELKLMIAGQMRYDIDKSCCSPNRKNAVTLAVSVCLKSCGCKEAISDVKYIRNHEMFSGLYTERTLYSVTLRNEVVFLLLKYRCYHGIYFGVKIAEILKSLRLYGIRYNKKLQSS